MAIGFSNSNIFDDKMRQGLESSCFVLPLHEVTDPEVHYAIATRISPDAWPWGEARRCRAMENIKIMFNYISCREIKR